MNDSINAEKEILLKGITLNVYYGKIRALKNISFHVQKKEIVSVIGPNGAGKSTLLKTIFGFLKPREGDIFFQGESLKNAKQSMIVMRGISYSPQEKKVFPSLTVFENLKLGAFVEKRKSLVKGRLEEVVELFPRLRERAKQLAGTLSGGEQQMVALARILMLEPKLILVDEPSLGLAPMLVRETFEKLVELVEKKGLSVLLAEQNARAALEAGDRGYILNLGEIVCEDLCERLLNDKMVIKSYLGG
jgi:branched-chain amino acid transport system ATP-binding protein